MKILVVSDPPMEPSSYGGQVAQLVPRLEAAGHEITVYGLSYHGQAMDYNGISIIGGNGDIRGEHMGLYAQRVEADIILTLKDPYIFDTRVLKSLSVPWVPWVAIDTEPMSAKLVGYMAWALQPLAMSRNGQTLMAEQSIQAAYAPPGIDTAFWTPGTQQEARARLGLPQDVFIAAFVGANQTNPSRKSLDQVILAWQLFLETHPGQREAVLVLHTNLGDSQGGIYAKGMLQALNLSERNWRASDQLLYAAGYITREYVRDIYRAADVLLNPAMGRGFELCIAEAQACGTPAISCNWTAMRETNWSGWQIDERAGGELFWCDLGAFRFRPRRVAIAKCLHMALEKRGDARIQEAARAGALRYDIERVTREHWLPILAGIERLLGGVLDQASLLAGDGLVGQPTSLEIA